MGIPLFPKRNTHTVYMKKQGCRIGNAAAHSPTQEIRTWTPGLDVLLFWKQFISSSRVYNRQRTRQQR